MSELSKLLLEMRTVLFGSDQSEPNADACEQLTREFFKEDTLRLLIVSLPKLAMGVSSKSINQDGFMNNLQLTIY